MLSLPRIAVGILSVISWALLTLPSNPVQGQEKPHPIFEQVKAKLKNPNKSFTMLVRFKVKEGAGAKLEEGFGPAIKATRKEKGCLAYELNRDLDNPNQYVLYERWKTLADLGDHLKAPYIASLGPKLGDWLDEPPGLTVLVPAGK